MKAAGAGAAGVLMPKWAFAGPFQSTELDHLIPADKRLNPGWIKSLTARGKRRVYRGDELTPIGMPIGGICAGMVYLGGDGDLWMWDIFNKNQFGVSPEKVMFRGVNLDAGGGAAYVKPPRPFKPFQQGFSIRVDGVDRSLDRRGWTGVEFTGEYPIGFVTYRDPACPVVVQLQAYSPFAPLDADDSGLPAILLEYTVVNEGDKDVSVVLKGFLENPVCINSRSSGRIRFDCTRQQTEKAIGFLFSARDEPAPAGARPAIVFEDFQKPTYEGWTVAGTAFGAGPIERSKIPAYQGDVGGPGGRVVNSHASAPGATVADKDAATGRLTSKPFTIQRDYVNFWIGGGNHPGKACLNLVVEGKVLRSATGRDSNAMRPESFDVRDLQGKEGRIEIVDDETGGWGNVGVGEITLADVSSNFEPLQQRADYGTMALYNLFDTEPGTSSRRSGSDSWSGTVPPRPGNPPALSSIGSSFTLRPGKSEKTVFLIAWHFPNLRLGIADDSSKRHYAKRFSDASAVADHVSANYRRLSSQTKLWHKTWYDSTLPYWFLDRSMANLTTLATTVCHRFGSGRFWAWEGVGCCVGTCTHVWQYAQAMARVFPEIERDQRERVDYGIGFKEETGGIAMRAEFQAQPAVDGQAGTILRTLREHQMAPDDAFLKRVWPKVKKATEYLIGFDTGHTGIMEGAQDNTLDAAWYGKDSWLSSLYVAALAASETMARELGDSEFADRCKAIFERGSKNLVSELFNGEYFVQTVDPAHPTALGTYDCCHIDQVMGQSWAWQVGLPRVTERDPTLSALKALWKYNFTPDVGPWRDKMRVGRWYAMPGEGGLVMTTNPKDEKDPFKDPNAWQAGYFNECMSGFEHQVASHMIAEGMVTEGLAVMRAIHDRYSNGKRNPWNEVECSDHYSRAMASYGCFVSACGFEVHGPKGHVGFAPRWSVGNFRAPFVGPEGWGTFSQRMTARSLRATIEVRSGALNIKTVALRAPADFKDRCKVVTSGKALVAQTHRDGERVVLEFEQKVTVGTGENLVVALT